MVPAIVVHCCNELELRGMQEVGLYRVPGSEREVRELREKVFTPNIRGLGFVNGIPSLILPSNSIQPLFAEP